MKRNSKLRDAVAVALMFGWILGGLVVTVYLAYTTGGLVGALLGIVTFALTLGLIDSVGGWIQRRVGSRLRPTGPIRRRDRR